MSVINKLFRQQTKNYSDKFYFLTNKFMKYAKYFLISLTLSFFSFLVLSLLMPYPKCDDTVDPTFLGLQINLPVLLVWFFIYITPIVALPCLVLAGINHLLKKKINLTKYLLLLVILIALVIGGHYGTVIGY